MDTEIKTCVYSEALRKFGTKGKLYFVVKIFKFMADSTIVISCCPLAWDCCALVPETEII